VTSAREVTENTWNDKLDSELRNKVNFGTNPTNPQADTIVTGRHEFCVMDIDLVKPRKKFENLSIDHRHIHALNHSQELLFPTEPADTYPKS